MTTTNRMGVRSDTWTPIWDDWAMIGPAANRATAEGRRATRGASRARKVSSSKSTMNTNDRSSVSIWMWLVWFCSSTDWATEPVRCMATPGCEPDDVNAERSSSTVRVVTLPVEDDGRFSSTRALRALPLAETPWSSTAVTRGTDRMAASARLMAASMKVASDCDCELKGAASLPACTLGTLAGRKSELLLFSTLERGGRATLSTTATMTQAATISHRNRTVNRPRAANKR